MHTNGYFMYSTLSMLGVHLVPQQENYMRERKGIEGQIDKVSKIAVFFLFLQLYNPKFNSPSHSSN